MPFIIRRRSIPRFFAICTAIFFFKLFFSSSSSQPDPSSPVHTPISNHEIKRHNIFERITRPDKSLNVHKHKFLQARMGRDDREGVLGQVIQNGVWDYWSRFQLPYIMNRETSSTDTQHVVSSINQLLSLNGWVAALCPTLTRPFNQNNNHHAPDEETYNDLIRLDHLYYIAIIIHSADHFLVDQLAVIVQMAKRLGSSNLFVSMLDYDSSDSTETLTDLCEAALILLGVPFRIRRVPGMTQDPAAAYYPLEEAHMRNLALEPLRELNEKRGIKFHRVIWLKGFTCPNDILETIKVSLANEAAMVCGMDWAEHNGLFIFSDRWRTRDIEGDQFRQSKSSSKDPTAVPPRDPLGASRYTQHLPFQVFCCESGTHVVDPSQSYYKGIRYRSGLDFHNLSRSDSGTGANGGGGSGGGGGGVIQQRAPDAPCLDSSQAWFCRDLWVRSAKDAMEEVDRARSAGGVLRRRDLDDVAAAAANDPLRDQEPREPADPAAKAKPLEAIEKKQEADELVEKRKDPAQVVDPDANAGSDYDAMPAEDGGEDVPQPPVVPPKLAIPNSDFTPARILVNPRCVTTYAGVSHTQLALDLFGNGDGDGDGMGDAEVQLESGGVKTYVLDDWDGAPESFVCQEQGQTGGRKATKTQRRLGFSIYDELRRVP